MSTPSRSAPAMLATLLLLLLMGLGVTACSSTPSLDRRGDATTRKLLASQVIDPEAGKRNANQPILLDGKAAKGGVDAYQGSFKSGSTSSQAQPGGAFGELIAR